jgi:hypothetical protein
METPYHGGKSATDDLFDAAYHLHDTEMSATSDDDQAICNLHHHCLFAAHTLSWIPSFTINAMPMKPPQGKRICCHVQPRGNSVVRHTICAFCPMMERVQPSIAKRFSPPTP